jgi:hypothetical protein
MEKLTISSIKEPTWEVEIKDGLTVNLVSPMKKDIESLTAIDYRNPDKIYEAITSILSRNADGRIITASDIGHWSIHVIRVFISGYKKFMLQDDNPN